MKSLILSISLMFACVSLSLADQLGFHLTTKNHPVGTRLLVPCSTSSGITLRNNYLVHLPSENEECYRELIVNEWAPSSKYVRLCAVSADPKEACGWHRASEFVALEELIKK